MDEGLIRTGFKAVWEKSQPIHLVFPWKNPSGDYSRLTKNT
jgi:hypothetical protein